MAYRDIVLSDSPGSFWMLGEPSGTNADDLGSLANDGTYTGTPTLGVTGALSDPDTAVDFSGTGQYVSVPDAAGYSLPTTGLLSVEAWFNPDTDGVQGYVVAKGTTAAFEWAFRKDADNTINFYLWTSAAALRANPGTPVLAADGWVHVVCTLDESITTARLYKNGVLAASDTTWSGVSTDGTGLLNIGRRADGASAFDGQIGLVAIYPHVLTAERVALHYSARLASPTIPASTGYSLFPKTKLRRVA